jgi:aspartate-semialdehyde dehydrogenase
MIVTIVGATGAVGQTLLDVLGDGALEVDEVRAVASKRSEGREVEFEGEPLAVRGLDDAAFDGAAVAFFCAPAAVSREWAPRARARGAAVVDLSPAFRVDPDVPLVVPEVNPAAIAGGRSRGIVASPGAAAVHAALALKPLHDAAGLERVVATALESASGAGCRGVEQLERESASLMNGVEPEAGPAIPHRAAFNAVPQAGAFGPSGYSEEELRIAAELRRVLGLLELPVAATAVRVPLFYGHALALNVQTRRKLGAAEARDLLRRAPGLKVLDDPAQGVYPMPMLAVNDDAVHAGRIRDDLSSPRGLELVVCGDNLRSGAATNAVRIARELLGRQR